MPPRKPDPKPAAAPEANPVLRAIEAAQQAVAALDARELAERERAAIEHGDVTPPPTLEAPPPSGPVYLAPPAGAVAPPAWVMPPAALCLCEVIPGSGIVCTLGFGHAGVHESRT